MTWKAKRLARVKSAIIGGAAAALNLYGSLSSPPYTRLFIPGDKVGWSLSHDMKELKSIGERLGISSHTCHQLRGISRQCVFFTEIRDTFTYRLYDSDNRIGGAYFHGKPGCGSQADDRNFQGLCKQHYRISRLQVTNKAFRDVILDSGIEPAKVHLIPIGVNLNYFHPQTPESRKNARTLYGIPESAIVVGSFQKDGQGWGEGNEPKLIKGPDIFIKTLAILKQRIRDLFIVLSGPARGYIKNELTRLNIPYKHLRVAKYAEIGQLFQCLDLYIVASREEGGPKAVLESMASGVPLVSTRVGQAADLIRNGENAWLADVEDSDGLAHWSEFALDKRVSIETVLRAGRETAERHSYVALGPLWQSFLSGFVERSTADSRSALKLDGDFDRHPR